MRQLPLRTASLRGCLGSNSDERGRKRGQGKEPTPTNGAAAPSPSTPSVGKLGASNRTAAEAPAIAAPSTPPPDRRKIAMTPAMTRPVPTGREPFARGSVPLLVAVRIGRLQHAVAEQRRRQVERQRRDDRPGPARDLPSDQRAEHRSRAGGGAGDREEVDELAAVDPAADHHRLVLNGGDDRRATADRQQRQRNEDQHQREERVVAHGSGSAPGERDAERRDHQHHRDQRPAQEADAGRRDGDDDETGRKPPRPLHPAQADDQ